MSFSVDALLGVLKQNSPKFFLGIALATGIILFAPTNFIRILGLEIIKQELQSQIGLTFIISTSLSVVHVLYAAAKFVNDKAKRKRRANYTNDERQNYMAELTRAEVLYLIPFLTGMNTLYFTLEDGIRGGLEAKNIIYRSADIGSILKGWAYNIQPWAKKYLEDNPQVIEKHVGKIKTEGDFKKLYPDGPPWQRI